MEFIISKFVLLAFMTTAVQCNKYLQISQTSIDKTQILYSINDTTVTSCHMKCAQDPMCDTIGLTQGSNKGPLYNCHLLKENATPMNTKHKTDIIEMKKLGEIIEDTKIVPKWKRRTFVSCTERQIKKGVLLGTLSVTKEYRMHVEVKPTKFIDDWSTIVLFGKGVKDNEYGDRTPMIFFENSKKGKLYITSAVNGDAKYAYLCEEVYPLNQWITVEVSQLKEGDDYVFSITVNGKKVHSVKNMQPEGFRNVAVYLGGVWGVAQPGFVRNLWMMVEN